MASYKIHIDYDDEQQKYYIWVESDDYDIQNFYTSVEAPKIEFTRNRNMVKRVLDSSIYVS